MNGNYYVQTYVKSKTVVLSGLFSIQLMVMALCHKYHILFLKPTNLFVKAMMAAFSCKAGFFYSFEKLIFIIVMSQ